MRSRFGIGRELLLSLLLLAMPLPAQVEKVEMLTTGISCGACAGLSEIYFRRMPGIAKVTISLSKESITLFYKLGTKFDPPALRKVLQPLEVGIVKFQITARGLIQEQGGKRILIAGKDTFALMGDTAGPATHSGTEIRIQGLLINERSALMELRILNVMLGQQ